MGSSDFQVANSSINTSGISFFYDSGGIHSIDSLDHLFLKQGINQLGIINFYPIGFWLQYDLLSFADFPDFEGFSGLSTYDGDIVVCDSSFDFLSEELVRKIHINLLSFAITTSTEGIHFEFTFLIITLVCISKCVHRYKWRLEL
jgi:hypothetical protein